MLDGLEGWHIVIIVAIAALLFGSSKLPGAARSMGQSLRIFKSELRAGAEDETVQTTTPSAQAAVTQAATPQAAPQVVAQPQVLENATVTTPSPVATPTPTATPAPFGDPVPVPVVQNTPTQQ